MDPLVHGPLDHETLAQDLRSEVDARGVQADALGTTDGGLQHGHPPWVVGRDDCPLNRSIV